MKLTNTAVKNFKPLEKPFKKADGGGLYLEVMPNGSKYWRMKYRFLGKEKRLAIGVYPIITLAEAREKALEAEKLLADHTNLSQENYCANITNCASYRSAYCDNIYWSNAHANRKVFLL